MIVCQRAPRDIGGVYQNPDEEKGGISRPSTKDRRGSGISRKREEEGTRHGRLYHKHNHEERGPQTRGPARRCHCLRQSCPGRSNEQPLPVRWIQRRGIDHPPVERSKQGYTARVIYQDSDAKTIALITIRAPTIAAFTNAANQIAGNNAIATCARGNPNP